MTYGKLVKLELSCKIVMCQIRIYHTKKIMKQFINHILAVIND